MWLITYPCTSPSSWIPPAEGNIGEANLSLSSQSQNLGMVVAVYWRGSPERQKQWGASVICITSLSGSWLWWDGEAWLRGGKTPLSDAQWREVPSNTGGETEWWKPFQVALCVQIKENTADFFGTVLWPIFNTTLVPWEKYPMVR